MCHFNIVYVIKPPNLIDLLYWQFAAMSVENGGNGQTWRMPANISDIPDIGDFIRRSPRSAYKIARCVAGFTHNIFSLDCANFSKIVV